MVNKTTLIFDTTSGFLTTKKCVHSAMSCSLFSNHTFTNNVSFSGGSVQFAEIQARLRREDNWLSMTFFGAPSTWYHSMLDESNKIKMKRLTQLLSLLTNRCQHTQIKFGVTRLKLCEKLYCSFYVQGGTLTFRFKEI